MTNNNSVLIYGLIDPRTNEVRYVGQTVNPFRRLEDHMTSTWVTPAKKSWLRNLYANGAIPKMVVLDWVTPELADTHEQFWITTLWDDGHPLVNILHTPTNMNKVRPFGQRPPKQTERVYQYMDQVHQTEGRISSFSEVQQTLGIARSTASTLRNQWLEERGIQDD